MKDFGIIKLVFTTIKVKLADDRMEYYGHLYTYYSSKIFYNIEKIGIIS